MGNILSSLKAYGAEQDSAEGLWSYNNIYKQLKFTKVYKNVPQLWIKLVPWPTQLDKETVNIIGRQPIPFLELM